MALWSLAACVFVIVFVGFGFALNLRSEYLAVFLLIIPVLAISAWFVVRRGTRPVEELPEVRRLRTGLAERQSGVIGYLRSLQPTWWLLCAVVLVVLGVLLLLESRSGVIALPLFRRLLWLGLPVSAFVFGGLPHQSSSPYYASGWSSDGTANLLYGNQDLENIYLFDAQGKPLTDVYLYTEDGRPITLPLRLRARHRREGERGRGQQVPARQTRSRHL